MNTSNNNQKVVDRLAKTARTSYTPEQFQMIKDGINIGADNHKEIKRRSDEWYEERDRHRIESEPKVKAFIGGVISEIEEQSKKGYMQIVEDTLTSLMNALVNDEDACEEYFRNIKRIREQNRLLKAMEDKT